MKDYEGRVRDLAGEHTGKRNRGKEEVRALEDLESSIEDACDTTLQKSGTKRVRQRNKY